MATASRKTQRKEDAALAEESPAQLLKKGRVEAAGTTPLKEGAAFTPSKSHRAYTTSCTGIIELLKATHMSRVVQPAELVRARASRAGGVINQPARALPRC